MSQQITCCSPRTLGRGAQAIRKTCSRLSPGTYFACQMDPVTRPCGGRCWRAAHAANRIHSLFTISNTRGPLHEEQDTRVSLTALRTTKRLDPWWSQTGSNRRPHACKARALPTELWPHGDETTAIRSRMVGLGRLERPTSPLSGVRSNHLSYRPHPRNPEDKPKRAQARHPDHALSVNEKRETKTAASRITGSD